MSDLNQRIANLSPEKLTLFERELMRRHALGNDDLAIPRRGEPGPCVPSFGQERLWFLSQLEPDSPAYNNANAFRIKGVLNVEALERALDYIVSRHEVLRTTLTVVDDSLKQIIAETWSLVMPVIDLRRTPEADREEELEHLILTETRSPFNLSQDLMLRATLLRLDDDTHMLLLVIHHIANDGWSNGILFHELSVLYESLSTERPSDLPELPIQYADYSLWQRELLDEEHLESHLSYWKGQLGPSPAVLELPTDRPRPAVETFRGGKQFLMLSRSLTDDLEALSQREGATLFITVLAAFQTLLYRYTGQEDISVGSPIGRRTRIETEGLIGFFVNTLVLRTDLSGNPSFRELLGRLREVVLGAYDHQDLPFERLVEEIRPERSLSHSPLFQVMFAFLNASATVLELPGVTVSSQATDNGTAKFDLTLIMTETESGLRGMLEYNMDLFDDATIDRMMGHLQTLLEGIVAHPGETISDLPLLTEAERHQLLVEWNDTKLDYPRDKCIHRLFEDQAERSPKAIALVFEGQQRTYRELNARANQVAHYLRKLGVGPEALVGICIERSLEMVEGILGILKAGGAYLPLDPTYPKERLALMLEDAQASIVITQEPLAGYLPEDGVTLVCLDADQAVISRESEEILNGEATPDSLAYVIYTSGTTGIPKGILGTNQGAVNRLAWMWSRFPFEPEEVCCQKTSLSFVDSIWELFGPLLRGIPSVIIRDETVRDPFRLVDTLAAHHVTRIVLVPALLAAIMEGHTDLQRRLPKLKTWVTSGESLPVDLCQTFVERMPLCILLNLYGSSEVSADVTCYDTSAVSRDHARVPVGRPIANSQVYVLDSHLEPFPVGIPGELYVGGDGLARGYLNRHELTAEKFIGNPFSTDPQARLFKTGDQARYLPDGNIELLGRIDDQVKIRGFRVEPGEIEAVLRQHPGVGKVVVVGRHDLADGDQTQSNTVQRVVAYVVSSRQPPPADSELRSFAKEKLPSYMVPSAFVMLDDLPVSSNGKVDRQGLPYSDRYWPEQSGDFVPPRGAIELQLTKIWKKLLGVSPVGVTDDFFELGGSSLLAASLMTRVTKEFGGTLPLSTLFQAPTIEHMARVLDQQEWSPRWSSTVPVQPAGSKPPFFCVSGGGIHFLQGLACLLGPDQPTYGVLLERRGPGSRNSDWKQGFDFNDLLTRCVDDIRSVQPEGPYFLGGRSFGGAVAFGIVGMLREQGHEVNLLALFDAVRPGAKAGRLAEFLLFVRKTKFHAGELRELTPKEALAYVLRMSNRELSTLVWRIADKLYRGVGRPLPRALRNLDWVNKQASYYLQAIYPGNVTLFRAADRARRSYPDPLLGWSQLVEGEVETRVIPGDHNSMWQEPNVHILVEQLSNCLQEAQARHHIDDGVLLPG